MKKLLTIPILSVVAMLGSMAPAIADAPTDYIVSRSFEDVNVCTGETRTVTLTFSVSEHHHGDDILKTVKGSEETSDGYAGQGTETTRIVDGNRVFTNVKWISSNDETGGRYKVEHDLRINPSTGEVLEDELFIRCIREP